MTPPDGAEPAFAAESRVPLLLPGARAILLHGGRALLLFEEAEAPPPRRGRWRQGGAELGWTGARWRVETEAGARWCGLGLLDALPSVEGELSGEDEPGRWRLAAAPRVDVAPEPLAELARKAGVDRRAVFDFLRRHLLAAGPGDGAEARAHRAFARGFFTAAAERDGFIEILGAPDCGGVFAQGWSLSLGAGATSFAHLGADLALSEAEVAHFEREDILPPGKGFCLYGKDWTGDLDAVFFERDGRLLRLDVVGPGPARFDGPAATAHVAAILPRLACPTATLRAFKRICRPRFAGEDTLLRTEAPIAVGIDAALQAPDGGLLILGWMLDPLRRADLVLIKSTANLYAPLQERWVRLPRPDLCAGFAADPRFAGLLDPLDALHGFIAHVPASRSRTQGAQVYLELALDDDTCLFQPIALTPFESGERLPQILAALSPDEPELGRIVDVHLAPFLAGVPPRPAARPRVAAARPIPLGVPSRDRAVTAVMPVRSLAELQPVFGLLAGAPEAEAIELVLVAERRAASEMLRPLEHAFRFYGLSGALVVASERDGLAARLDAGAAAGSGARLLAWTPAALPKGAGWLAQLVAEADAIGTPALLSPALTYEDGSVAYGAGAGSGAAGVALATASAVAGYGPQWLLRGAPVEQPSGAAEIALVDRAALARAGGFAGRLFGDGSAHLDLAARLRAIGVATWCSGSVEFWMLEDPQSGEDDPRAQLVRRIDASLVAARRADAAGDLPA